MERHNEVAWAAGLFEGEGSISTTGVPAYPYLRFGLTTTDEDVIRQFARVVRVGSVSQPRTLASGKRAWAWRAAALSDVQHVIELFRPYLSGRRSARLAEVMATDPRFEQE
jgi:hypothetical protein